MKTLSQLQIASVIFYLTSCSIFPYQTDEIQYPDDPDDFQSGWSILGEKPIKQVQDLFLFQDGKLGATFENPKNITKWDGTRWKSYNPFSGPVASDKYGKLYAIYDENWIYPLSDSDFGGISPGLPLIDTPHSMAIDSMDNIYISGSYADPGWFYMIFEKVFRLRKVKEGYIEEFMYYYDPHDWIMTSRKLYTDKVQNIYLSIGDTLLMVKNDRLISLEGMIRYPYSRTLTWDSNNNLYLIGRSLTDSLSSVYKWDRVSMTCTKVQCDDNYFYMNLAFDSADKLYAVVLDRTKRRYEVVRLEDGVWSKLGDLNVNGMISSICLDKADRLYVSGSVYANTETGIAIAYHFVAAYGQ